MEIKAEIEKEWWRGREEGGQKEKEGREREGKEREEERIEGSRSRDYLDTIWKTRLFGEMYWKEKHGTRSRYILFMYRTLVARTHSQNIRNIN